DSTQHWTHQQRKFPPTVYIYILLVMELFGSSSFKASNNNNSHRNDGNLDGQPRTLVIEKRPFNNQDPWFKISSAKHPQLSRAAFSKVNCNPSKKLRWTFDRTSSLC
ncbi:MAG: hypothetical protein ACKPKO_51430, partial [Candidatus Fonsibacter sp.]